jgi:hypothetical protein
VKARKNYYEGLTANFSTPQRVPEDVSQQLLADAAVYNSSAEPTLPDINDDYSLGQIERENKAWWPTHCEALRQGRADLLTGEYRDELVYFCADGPFYGLSEGNKREQHWWALISQPNVTMVWPIVMFHGEFVFFEWFCHDDITGEVIAKGNVTWVRRGHRGGCYLKTEQLTFYRDVYASPELLGLLK